jgi:hypothetical protein
MAGVFKPGQSVALYADGEKVSEDTTSIPSAVGLSGVFKIGARADNTTQGHWDGRIDEVHVIGRVLTQAEIEGVMERSGQAQDERAAMTKYYYAGGQRVAMREGGALYYLLGDHLASTAITADSSGTKEAELRYKAFGETRYSWGDTPTERRFTGQIEDSTMGLYFYNARYYDTESGWLSPGRTVSTWCARTVRNSGAWWICTCRPKSKTGTCGRRRWRPPPGHRMAHGSFITALHPRDRPFSRRG